MTHLGRKQAACRWEAFPGKGSWKKREVRSEIGKNKVKKFEAEVGKIFIT